MSHILFLDSTLRDGAQGEDISFSLSDKLTIAHELDDFGIDFIEAGTPGANPKDLEFFRLAAKNSFRHARLCAFAPTRHKGIKPENDEQLQMLLMAETDIAVIFGKTWQLHVDKILKVSPQENLDMIASTIQYLREKGRTVFFDAEHFFDGFADNPDYALTILKTALQAGAQNVTLCDTNGGTTPTNIRLATEQVIRTLNTRNLASHVGIHCHNDIGCAIANSMLAVEAGATLVQGTFSGFGERCGNADLSILIPNLILKKNCTSNVTQLNGLLNAATKLAEISNIAIPGNKPYIGKSAFAHKGGMHIDGVLKDSDSFEHIAPETIGNHRRFLASEVSGRSTILTKMKPFAPQFTKDSPELAAIVSKVKEMEYAGYQFEGADASLELLIRKTLGWHTPHFKLLLYKTTGEFPAPNGNEQDTAMIQVMVGKSTEISAALGNGPVNALDSALRKALNIFYPQLTKVQLIDYKVRVIDPNAATAARVRVLIESSNGTTSWTTIGVSSDIIEASWIALQDSIEYMLGVIEPTPPVLPQNC